MTTIRATNVNDAWPQAIQLIDATTASEPSRAGPVRRFNGPVMTIYSQPWQRVLFDPVRDANPIFHLHEALWMLAGSDDATWLDQFVSDFSQRFAEPDGHQHGAYGARWRKHFRLAGLTCDQLTEVVDLLKADPNTRQAVIQMWDAEVDLAVRGLKDRPCNTHIYLTLSNGHLDIGVMCRSNDLIWGCYGANVVHMSVLQEYLAARIGVAMGKMYQFSWNWHMYDNVKHLANHTSAMRINVYPGWQPLVDDPETFDAEVRAYVQDPTFATLNEFTNTFFVKTAYPMWMANVERKAGNTFTSALAWANQIEAPDWRKATVEWLGRRVKR